MFDIDPRDRERLAKLAADFASMLDNGGPTEHQLAAAPILDQWRVCPMLAYGLIGAVAGHPFVGPGQIITSPIWAMDERRGWARTVSRFYLLGRPAVKTT